MALAVLVLAGACRGTPVPAAQPVAPGPPAIPDTQPVVDAPLFVGQNAFASPLTQQTDYAPLLVTIRGDSGNTGIGDGPAPLGRAPVTGSAASPLAPPLLWGRGGLTAGCQVEIDPGLTKACLAAVDTSDLVVTARWVPPGQDLNLAGAVIDDSGRIIVTTRQRHLFILARPDAANPSFRVLRDIDLNGHLSTGQGVAGTVPDTNGNIWFASGGDAPSGPPATDTTVGYVTADDQVVTTTLADQRVETALAVDQANVYLVTTPAGAADHASGLGGLFDLTAGAGQVQTVWRESYDAGSTVAPGGTTRGSASAPLLLGSQYVAVTDNADSQAHLLVYLRGALTGPSARESTTTSTSTTAAGATPTTAGAGAASTTSPPVASATTATTNPTTNPLAGTSSTPASGIGGDARLVCRTALFDPGASAVTSAPVAYSSSDSNSVIVANGFNAPPPLAGPSGDGPANSMNAMAGGMARIDVRADGSGCQTQWTAALRLKTGPVLSTTTGLVYGYTQDAVRAATGSYVWYFVAVDYRTGLVVWRQRAGAGSTKNDDRQPTVLGANGVLYQTLPLGLVWMRDVAQRP